VKSLYDRHKAKRTRPSLEEISNALHSVVPDFSTIFIIIDALDECQVSNGGRTKFLTEILNLQAKAAVNLFTAAFLRLNRSPYLITVDSLEVYISVFFN
jgi:hypothetical protein